MAGPHVVGVVALLWSARPELSRDITDTKTILQNTANPSVVVSPAQTCGGTPSSQIPNNSFGYGRVDALAAVNSVPLATPSPTSTVVPTVTPTSTSTNTLVPTATHTVAPGTTASATATSGPAGTATSTAVLPTATACPIEFSDVPNPSTFYAFIRCLACRGIVVWLLRWYLPS